MKAFQNFGGNQLVDLLSDPRERQNILISRVFLGFGALILLVTRLFSLFHGYSGFTDSFILGFSLYSAVLMLVSFYIPFIRRNLHELSIFTLYVYSLFIYYRLFDVGFLHEFFVGISVYLFVSSFLFNRLKMLSLFVIWNWFLFGMFYSVDPSKVDDGAVLYLGLISFSVFLLSWVNIRRIRLLEDRSFHFNTVFEHLNDGVMIVDRAQKIRFVNYRMTEIVGYEKDSLIDQNAKIMLIASGFGDTMEKENESRRLGKGNRFDIKLRRSDNTIIDVEISGSPIYDQNGQLVGSIGIHKDITQQMASDKAQKAYSRDITNLNRELLKTVSELEESNHELERFAYATSHDLKTPLRSISGFARLIQRRYSSQIDKEADEYISLILKGCQNMDALIDGLLDYSRSGNKKLNFEEFDLNEVVVGIIQQDQNLLAENKAQIKLEGKMPIMIGNRVQLQQVFQNLIENAIKYRREVAPEITIRYRSYESDKGSHYFEIEDNGKGIPADQFKHIFTVFHRLENQSIRGSGIGLSICRRVIQNHGGEIWVSSVLGRGSIFHIKMPKEIEIDTEGQHTSDQSFEELDSALNS